MMKKLILLVLIMTVNTYSQTELHKKETARIDLIREKLFLVKGRYNLQPKNKECLRLRYLVAPGWENQFSIEIFIPVVEGRLGDYTLIEYREKNVKYNIDDTIASDSVIVKRHKLGEDLEGVESLIKECIGLESVVSPLEKKSGYISDGGDQFVTIEYGGKKMSFVRVAGDPEYIENKLKKLFAKMYGLKEAFFKVK